MIREMSGMPLMRRLAAFLCIALLLLAVCVPGVAGQTLAILACLWCVVPVALFLEIVEFEEEAPLQQAPVFAALSPRPPPAR
jgi:hypothetical protein